VRDRIECCSNVVILLTSIDLMFYGAKMTQATVLLNFVKVVQRFGVFGL
jgi:hypothetical protein